MKQKIISGNVYNKYGTSNIVYRRLIANFERHLLALLTQSVPRSMLEVGCGEGHWIAQIGERMPEIELVGLDIGIEVLQEARQASPSAQFLQGSALGLPFASNSFDHVLATEVLEHLPDPAAAVAELARITRRHCVISVPYEPFWRLLNMARLHYLSAWGNTPGHIQHFNPRALQKLVSAHFTILSRQIAFPWILLLAEKQP